jgi:hypothetical protein
MKGKQSKAKQSKAKQSYRGMHTLGRTSPGRPRQSRLTSRALRLPWSLPSIESECRPGADAPFNHQPLMTSLASCHRMPRPERASHCQCPASETVTLGSGQWRDGPGRKHGRAIRVAAGAMQPQAPLQAHWGSRRTHEPPRRPAPLHWHCQWQHYHHRQCPLSTRSSKVPVPVSALAP